MRLAHEILDQHPFNQERRAAGKMPANGIWFWAEGTAVELPSFVEQYGHTRRRDQRGASVCTASVSCRGLQMIEVEGATGEIDTNL